MNDPVNENGRPSANLSSSPDAVRPAPEGGDKTGYYIRERSQGRAAMPDHEVASPPSLMGLLMGQSCERASALRAKFASPTRWRFAEAMYAVNRSGAGRVKHAITWRTRINHSTDEVPRCPGRKAQVSTGYKSHTKCLSDASEMGTGSSRPHPKGCQQSQSRGNRRVLPEATSKGKTSVYCSDWARTWAKLAPAVKATKWPGQTSSGQTVNQLRNMPQHLVRIRAMVRQH